MAEIPKTIDAADTRTYLRSLFFERKDNQLFCVATNGRCAAIEYLGRNDGPNEHAAIICDTQFVNICDHETKFDGKIQIEVVDALGFAKLVTTFGGMLNGNGFVPLPNDHEFQRWRDWMPKEIPTQSYGTMFWNTTSIYALSCACKSGGLTFPQHIDIRKPVVINDAQYSDWVGVFMPSAKDIEIKNVIIPDWV